MKKLILNWLFGTDDVKEYIDLLCETRDNTEYARSLVDDHIKTLKREKEHIDMLRKLMKVCENHEIDVDEEIKHIEL